MRRLLTLLLLLVAAAPAGAFTRLAKVTYVEDGDTMTVKYAGSGGLKRIRVYGIQAMEQITYNLHHRTGQCHAVAATKRLEGLVRRSHWRVKLQISNPNVFSMGRRWMGVWVRQGGRWVDASAIMLAEGHALWFPLPTLRDHHDEYRRLAEQARLNGRNLYNPTTCGVGPAQSAPLQVWIRSDPVSIDAQDINGEWMRVYNPSALRIDLSRWWIRDSDLDRFTFPAGTTLEPHGSVTVHVGQGSNGGGDFYWGKDYLKFTNADEPGGGDGAYLFDPQGDLRASMIYPCVVGCQAPYRGHLKLSVHAHDPEYFDVTNRGSSAADLYGLLLHIKGSTYPFPDGAVLGPGDTFRLYVGSGRDVKLTRHWGIDHFFLPDAGGWARVETFDNVTVDCDAWGSGHC